MEAHGHALLAGCVVVSGLIVAHATLDTAMVALPVTVAGSLLPDLDEPGSAVSRSFGVVSELISWIVKHISGGHRKLTHSLIGAGLLTVLFTVVAIYIHYGVAICAGMCVALCIIGLLPKHLFIRHMIAMVGAVSVATYAFHNHIAFSYMFSMALFVGIVLHLVGDSLTPSGVMWFWPNTKHLSMRLFSTGSRKESIVTVGLFLLFILLGFVYFNTTHTLNTAISDVTHVLYHSSRTK